MKIILFICSFSLIFCSFQCRSTKPKEVNVLNNYKFDTIVNVHNIDFNVRHNGGDDLVFYDAAFYQIFDFCGDSSIRIINLRNNNLNTLRYADPNCGQVYVSLKKNGYYVVSVDNVVYHYPRGDSNGRQVLDLMTIDKFNKSGLTPWWHKVWGNQHVNIPDDVLYFRLEKDLDSDSGKYSLLDSLYPIFAKVNLITKEVGFYGRRSGVGPGLMHSSFELYMQDSIFVTYSYTEKIERINTINGETYAFYAKSSFDTVPIQTFKYDEATYTLDKNIKHCLESANYGPLYYNPYNKHYYRIFHPYLPERDNNGEMNTDYDKESVLMIMDQNLKLKEEVLLPVKSSRLMTLYPVPEGVDFYMAPDHITPKEDKTEFKYLRYKHK